MWHKCSVRTLVSGNISLCAYLREFSGKDASNDYVCINPTKTRAQPSAQRNANIHSCQVVSAEKFQT